MFGIKNFFGWLRPKKEVVDLVRNAAHVFASFERLQKQGLLHWDVKARRLLVCEPLARVMLRSQETWDGFMKNVFLWQTYVRQQEAWERYFIKEEGKAVREAQRKYCIVTKAEVGRIRRRVRENTDMGKVPTPRIEPYEVFIIGDSTPPLRSDDDHRKAEAVGQILAVGRYDPDTEHTQMAMWEEVRKRL